MSRAPNKRRNVENAGARQLRALEYRSDFGSPEARPRVLYIPRLNEAAVDGGWALGWGLIRKVSGWAWLAGLRRLRQSEKPVPGVTESG